MEFKARFDTTWEGKVFKKGDSLPYEARNCPASIRSDSIESKIEKEDKTFNWKDSTSKNKIDKFAESKGLTLDRRKSLDVMKEQLGKYLKRKG